MKQGDILDSAIAAAKYHASESHDLLRIEHLQPRPGDIVAVHVRSPRPSGGYIETLKEALLAAKDKCPGVTFIMMPVDNANLHVMTDEQITDLLDKLIDIRTQRLSSPGGYND